MIFFVHKFCIHSFRYAHKMKTEEQLRCFPLLLNSFHLSDFLHLLKTHCLFVIELSVGVLCSFSFIATDSECL